MHITGQRCLCGKEIMVEPKTFYRELDAILTTIRKEESGDQYFQSILRELEQRFGKALNISRSHIYEKRGNEYVMVHSTAAKKDLRILTRISAEDSAVQLILRHRSYIFNQPENLGGFCQSISAGDMMLAAISVNNPDRWWLFVFELAPGWAWEEIILFMNAVRTALNYRLFSEMIHTELERSVQIQKSLLPKSAPDVQGYDVFGLSQPAELVGGDFYDYYILDNEMFGVSLGDASGHGLPAALLVRDVVIGLRMGLATEMRLLYMIRKLNYVIQQSTYSTNFVSLFVGELEKEGHLFYVNAGHPPPFVISDQRTIDLEATGITLGFLSEIELTRSHVHMQRGSLLVIYSDGIIERKNNTEEMFGVNRLKELTMKHRDQSAKALVGMVFDEVYRFGGRTNWDDDATLVIIKRTD